MIVVRKSRFSQSKPVRLENKKKFNNLKLIHSSFSSKKLSRQFPLLAGLHNALDGALIGVIISVALMSSLALHWRHLWIVAFTRLEITRDLSHRLVDSTAMLERNLLRSNSFPMSMVPTKAENLFYLENPFRSLEVKKNNNNFLSIIKNLNSYPIHTGY